MIFGALFPLLIVLVAFIVLYVLRRVRARRLRVSSPSCAACRYDVRGLESFICPECGSDLREVGIITPDTPVGPGRGLAIARWTVLMLIAGPILASLIMWYIGPMQTITSDSVQIAGLATSQPNDLIEVQRTSERTIWFAGFRSPRNQGAIDRSHDSVQITLTMPASFGVGPLHLASPGEYTFDVDGRRMTGQADDDEAAIELWLEHAGLDPNDAQVSAQSQELASIVRQPGRLGNAAGLNAFARIAGRGSRSNTSASTLGIVLACGPVFVLWLTVTMYLWRKHRPIEPRPAG